MSNTCSLQKILNTWRLIIFYLVAYGNGLDKSAPQLVAGCPPPIGSRRANFDNETRRIIGEFGLEEVGHLRALKSTIGGFSRPLLDLSESNFANIMNNAFGYNSIRQQDYWELKLAKTLLSDTIYIYERGQQFVHPYNITVTEFTNRISILRNNLGMCGIKDEGVFVDPILGAEMNTCSNVLSADRNSLSCDRSPQEILRIVYGTGNESVPGGFFPRGAKGKIAQG